MTDLSRLHWIRYCSGLAFLILASSFSNGERSAVKGRLGVGFVTQIVTKNDADSEEAYCIPRRSLEKVPLIVSATLSLPLDAGDEELRIVGPGGSWRHAFGVILMRDRLVDSRYDLVEIAHSEIVNDRSPRNEHVGGSPLPKMLKAGEEVRCSWVVRGPQGYDLESGLYELEVSTTSRAGGILGASVFIRSGPGVSIVEDPNRNADRDVEDVVQRLYLAGHWFYSFDKPTSRKFFQDAHDLLCDYRRRGFGDSARAWNITPRWQSHLITEWLDRPKESIAFLSDVLSGHGTMRNLGQECMMRYYHFGLERGFLPSNVEGDLSQKVNRLYEALYGRRMNGQTCQPLRPWPRKFVENPDPIQELGSPND